MFRYFILIYEWGQLSINPLKVKFQNISFDVLAYQGTIISADNSRKYIKASVHIQLGISLFIIVRARFV